MRSALIVEGLSIPKVNWELTSLRVLATEWVDGAPMEGPGPNRVRRSCCFLIGSNHPNESLKRKTRPQIWERRAQKDSITQ